MLVSRARALAADDPLATTLLAALVLVRVTLPLAALAVSGSGLAGLPAYEYEARPGDAYGYYSAMRELMATVPRLGPAAPGVLLAVACLVVVFVRWRSRPQQRPLLALLAGASVAAIATLLVLRMSYAGAPTIGWPLVWSVPMLPYRMLGLPLDPDVAFGFGLALSLAANGVTVVSTYLLGLWTSGSRSTGLVAASLFGLWPFLLPVVGKTADLGTWQGDLGLSLYSEPLSTALVTTGAALLVRPGRGHVAEVVAGCLLGFSIAVRLSNLVIAVPLVALLALQAGLRSALRFGAAVAIFVPIAVAYWPLGYVQLPDEQFPDDPFALRYAVPAWRDSVVWGWEAFVALVPVAAVGFLALARPQAVLLASWILATTGLYTFYTFTPLHPRFLLVALPPLFVLWGAGASAVVQWAGAAFGRGSSSAASAR